jgi:Phage terminase, small subunit
MSKTQTNKLTFKQERFCQEYQIDLNATQAYKRAGYSANSDVIAASEGFKLLRNPKIKQRIDELQKQLAEKTGITAERVLNELAKIAFADTNDYVNVVEIPVVRYEQRGRKKVKKKVLVKTVDVVNTKNLPKEKRGVISEIKQTEAGISLKLHDKVSALEKLGRHLKLFTDKVELHPGESFLEFLKRTSSK